MGPARDRARADGYRTIAPFVRGFGPTRFADGAERTGEVAAPARDVLALADALGIERFHVVGHDWGARAGYAAAALAPVRLRSLTALAVAYGTPSTTHRRVVREPGLSRRRVVVVLPAPGLRPRRGGVREGP